MHAHGAGLPGRDTVCTGGSGPVLSSNRCCLFTFVLALGVGAAVCMTVCRRVKRHHTLPRSACACLGACGVVRVVHSPDPSRKVPTFVSFRGNVPINVHRKAAGENECPRTPIDVQPQQNLPINVHPFLNLPINVHTKGKFPTTVHLGIFFSPFLSFSLFSFTRPPRPLVALWLGARAGS